MDLFDFAQKPAAPLSERMRPETVGEFVGQGHLVGKDSLLVRAIKADVLGSCIFYGPPGTGKTTLSNIIASTTDSHFEKLNAVASGVADAKRVIEEAKERLKTQGKKTYLLLDECHRWSKAQSDSVLAAIEAGYIIFVGSTTENPYASMTNAIVSRCRIFEFKRLSADDIKAVLYRAVSDKRKGLGNYNVCIDADAVDHIAFFAGGDLRTALNSLELAVLTTAPDENGVIKIDLTAAEQSIQRKALSIDESAYYDNLSAFCKSLRGSDPNAALFYSERMIRAGIDPLIIFRRLLAHSAEDVGLADPNALVVAAAAMTAYEKMGYPEGIIPLSEAILYVCKAKKSNSVVAAMGAASEAAKKYADLEPPKYLRDINYKGEKITGYKYPHDYGGWVEQQYLPDEIKDKKFYIENPNDKKQ
ncbi:MAG: replication-associated recombination protein A [Clostridiales bacterium]|jgi:putative ATPase|nr:replication-associated recombination protein A [Clostridiales bacterium]